MFTLYSFCQHVHQEPDDIHYAALSVNLTSRPRRQRNNNQNECVYSSGKWQNFFFIGVHSVRRFSTPHTFTVQFLIFSLVGWLVDGSQIKGKNNFFDLFVWLVCIVHFTFYSPHKSPFCKFRCNMFMCNGMCGQIDRVFLDYLILLCKQGISGALYQRLIFMNNSIFRFQFFSSLQKMAAF